MGYVVRIQAEPARFRLYPTTKAGAFAYVHVVDKQGRLYHLLVPEPGARRIAAQDTLRAPASWVRRAGKWNLFADTVRVDAGRNRLDLTIPCVPLALPAPCVYCGDTVREDGEWGIDPAYRLECHACSSLRGRVTEEDFTLHCDERAALRSARTRPLPDKLPGTYTGEKGADPRIVLGADYRWRRDGDAHPAGDFSYHQDVVRLYEGGDIVHAFKVRNALNGFMLREVHRERSRGRRGAPPLTLVRARAETAPRAHRAAPKPPPTPEKRAAGRGTLQLFQRRFDRAHTRYEAIVAHELALNSLFVLAGRRTTPAHWERDEAEIRRIRAELAEECRRLQSSCRKFRGVGTRLGIFESAGDLPLVRRFTVLEQNAAKHPRPRGPVPDCPEGPPRPQLTQPAATVQPAPPAEPAEPAKRAPSPASAPPIVQPRARGGTSSDFGEKLRRALAAPGESIRTENC